MENFQYRSLKYLMVMITGSCLFLSCRVKHPPVTTAMAHLQEHPAEFKLEARDFQDEFKKILKDKTGSLPYAELIGRFYERKNHQPVLVPRFLPQGQLQVLLAYLSNVASHGLDTAMFSTQQLRIKLAEVNDRKSTNVLEIYRGLADLELSVAGSLIRYSMALQFGLTDPEKIYARYATPTLKPDSSAVMRIFEVRNLKNYLDSIQPKDQAYLALQKAIAATAGNGEKNDPEKVKVLTVNLERLRWRNRPRDQKFVQVNIAGFGLDVVDKGKSILHMKVCVGEPGTRETPQLGSLIHSVQVNPVWNIPQSIARNEISKHAAQDRYYLANNNINVYRKGKLIEDPESIDWSAVDVGDYSFQQQPGVENALGKIKFLFNNESSVYLHDTPVQSAFDQEMRAVSHGCVRVEKPLELAYALFGKGEKYNQIKKAMQSGYPRAKFISLPKTIPIRLVYYTARADDKGKLQYFGDVYDLDKALYTAIQNIQN